MRRLRCTLETGNWEDFNPPTPKNAASHRLIALKTRQSVFISGYGPAQYTPQWLDDTLQWAQQLGSEVILAGDLNWKPAYDALVPHSADTDATEVKFPVWSTTNMRPDTPTTTKATWPTRCLRWSKDKTKPVHVSSLHIPGIPYHALTTFECDQIKMPTRQLLRLRHTASYKLWKADAFTSPGDFQSLQSQVDEKIGKIDPTEAPSLQWTKMAYPCRSRPHLCH